MNKYILVLFGLLLSTLQYALSVYELNLLDYSEEHFNRLSELVGFQIESVDAKVYEYDQLNEFTKVTGAPFFVSAFSNKQGIHIQSRYLLGSRFQPAIIHELIHFTIKHQYPIPAWFEEGLVCLITQEFSDVHDIDPMLTVLDYDIRNAKNNWELVSYSLGCIEKVKELLTEDPATITSPTFNTSIP
ncbi:MAG TPA: hypothetical protein P5107_01125 [Thermotogota bacterium]|nr:hypothetical protein [Thermotogota bacterium]